MVKPENKKYVGWMLAGFGTISMSVLFFFFLYRLQGVGEAVDKVVDILMPFVYGGILAYLLRPMCNWYSRHTHELFKGKHGRLAEGIAILATFITGGLVVYVLIIMIAPDIVDSVVSLWNIIPEKVDELIAWIGKISGENEALLEYFNASSDTIYTAMNNWINNTLVPYATNVVSGVGNGVWKVLLFVKNLLIGLIVAVYLLASRKKFGKQGVLVVRSLVKPRWADLILEEIAYVDKMFGGFIDGKLVDSAIIGVLCYIGCSALRFPNALLVSVIVGVTNIIPFFGPFLGAIPGALLILIDSPIKALWFLLFILFLQQLDGNVIGPKILGNHTGVGSFWVLFSILLFGGLWGIVGMVIAVPLFAVIYDLLRRLVVRGLKKHGCEDMLNHYFGRAKVDASRTKEVTEE